MSLSLKNIALSLTLPILAASCDATKKADVQIIREGAHVDLIDQKKVDRELVAICGKVSIQVKTASALFPSPEAKEAALKEYFLRFEVLAKSLEIASLTEDLADDDTMKALDRRIEIGKAYRELREAFCRALPQLKETIAADLGADFDVARRAYGKYAESVGPSLRSGS